MSAQFFTRPPEQFGGKIPFVVTDLIDRLREMGAQNVEGVFRMSGSASGIADLSAELNNGRVTDWSKYPNVHTVACALKKYFRDMVGTDPLIPTVFYNEVLAIPGAPTDDEKVAKFKAVIGELTKVRRLTMAYLFRFLFEVSQSEVSKMHAGNIAIVFSPNLLSPEGGPTVEHTLLNTGDQNNAIKTLVSLTERVFDDVEIPETAVLTDSEIEELKTPPMGKEDIRRFKELRELRKRSVIPFAPYEFISDPAFERPSRSISFDAC